VSRKSYHISPHRAYPGNAVGAGRHELNISARTEIIGSMIPDMTKCRRSVMMTLRNDIVTYFSDKINQG